MRQAPQSKQAGITAIELIVAAALLMIGALMVPSLSTTVREQRSNAAARQLVSEIRHAQSQALVTGWQIRLVGYPSSATNGRANSYRLVGRASTASPWPDALGPALETTTQRVTPWTMLGSRFPGIDINPTSAGSDDFSITFDARGAVVSRDNFAPLSVLARRGEGQRRRLTVSPAGRVTIQ